MHMQQNVIMIKADHVIKPWLWIPVPKVERVNFLEHLA